MKNKTFLISMTFMALSTMLLQCSDEGIAVKEAFVGKWTISEFVYDGVVQDDWKGIEISFTQTTETRGDYTLSSTIDDTIWKLTGTWSEPTATEFTRDDDIQIMYGFQNDNILILDMYLPWTAWPNCTETFCLPAATGQWTLKLEKK